jgi:hypothetical protein
MDVVDEESKTKIESHIGEASDQSSIPNLSTKALASQYPS